MSKRKTACEKNVAAMSPQQICITMLNQINRLTDDVENCREGLEHIGNFLLNTREPRSPAFKEIYDATKENVPTLKSKKLPKRKQNKS